jgi:hypothetical protein
LRQNVLAATSEGRTTSEKSHRVGVEQIGESVRRDHHRTVAALDLDVFKPAALTQLRLASRAR